MVSPQKKARSVKKVKTRVPGGVTRLHFKAEKPGRPSCGRCGGVVASGAGRTYGGVLCPSCMRELFSYVTRMEAKYLHPKVFSGVEFVRDLTLERFLPQGWWAAVSSGKLKAVKPKPAGRKKERKAVEKPAESRSKPDKKKQDSRAKKSAK